MTIEDLRRYEKALADASIECRHLDGRHSSDNRKPPWLLWPFHDAPPALRALSQNGGDEDWILVIPKGEYAPVWSDEGMSGGFGCCTVEEYELPCGRVVRIGCHA